MSFQDLVCKKSIIDSLPSLNQRLLAADMICSPNFNHYDLVRMWYTQFKEDIYSFSFIIFLVIGLYILIFFPVSQKILVPSFISLKKRMNVTSILMAGIIYPIVFNYNVIILFSADVYGNYNFGVMITSMIIGTVIVLLSLIFGILHHFTDGDIIMPAYPIYICFAFIAMGLLIIAINGMFARTSWVFSVLMLLLFVFYLFAIQWAEKKEVEQLEKNRKAHEALENFQKMMGGGSESEELEKADEFRQIHKDKQAKLEEKTKLSLPEQLFTQAFDPGYHWLHNIVIGPIMLMLFTFVPYKGNPLMKTPLKNLVTTIGLFVLVELNFLFVVWWGRLIISSFLTAVILVLHDIEVTRKIVANVLDFFCIIIVVSLSSEMQLWVDDTITFFNFYFSLDIGAGFAMLNALKGVIVDTGTNIQLIRLGEKEALLNVYASPVFQLFVCWPILNLFANSAKNKYFPIFSEPTDKYFLDHGGVSGVTHKYLKVLFAFTFVLLIVKTIYYVVSDFKLNVYIRRTLYSIYVTFIAMTFYYGTMDPSKI